jgi:hypothetical protein
LETVYILTRTSGRPEFFKRCRASVKALTGFNFVHIVHSDDPRNEKYIECDILIRGEAHGKYMGSAPYNLYCNRMLDLLPGNGWVHFMDDDDYYASTDVFENLLKDADKEKMIIGKVTRANGAIYPRTGNSTEFQTEIFCLYSDKAKKAKWWGNKSGDHYYTRQLTRTMQLQRTDVMIAIAQEGRGLGMKLDAGGEAINLDGLMNPEQQVYVKMNLDKDGRRGAHLYQMSYADARVFEKNGYGRVTYKGVEVVNVSR